MAELCMGFGYKFKVFLNPHLTEKLKRSMGVYIIVTKVKRCLFDWIKTFLQKVSVVDL